MKMMQRKNMIFKAYNWIKIQAKFFENRRNYKKT